MSRAPLETKDDSPSIFSTSTTSSAKDVAKKVWTETQWTSLSIQAKNLGLPKLPYFEPKTMLLSKEVNARLWKQLLRLYDHLGAEQAPFATPLMVEGGEVKWFSYLGESNGEEADVFDYKYEKKKPEKRWVQEASLGKEREQYVASGLQR